ncbi:unnamed protein product [Camellia sinensis]
MASSSIKSTSSLISMIKMIFVLGELGGRDEYSLVEALKQGKISKPVVAWVSGTCARLFKSEVQFGHAGAKSGGEMESAQAKNQALHDAGAVVPTSFEAFETVIKETFEKLLRGAMLLLQRKFKPPQIPEDLNTAIKSGKVRAPTHIISTISDDRGEEPCYAGIPMSSIVEQGYGVGDVISLVWFKRSLPRYCTRFIEICVMLCADHGPCVSGAHNTIVTARAGKDLVSSLVSDGEEQKKLDVLSNDVFVKALISSGCTAYRTSQEPSVLKLKEPTLDEITHALVGRYNLNFTRQDISSLWFLCKQEASLLNITDQACALFTPSEVVLLEWTDDLELFILKGYGNALNYQMGVPLLEDVVQSMYEEHAPGCYEKARLRFAHAETLLPFSCLIGLFLEESDLAVCVRVLVEPKKAIRKLPRVQHLYASIDGEVEKGCQCFLFQKAPPVVQGGNKKYLLQMESCGDLGFVFIYQSLVIYNFVITSSSNSVDSNGKMFGLWDVSTMIFNCHVITVNLRLLLMCNMITRWHQITVGGSIVTWFILCG